MFMGGWVWAVGCGQVDAPALPGMATSLRLYSVRSYLSSFVDCCSLRVKVGRLFLLHMGGFGAWQSSLYYILRVFGSRLRWYLVFLHGGDIPADGVIRQATVRVERLSATYTLPTFLARWLAHWRRPSYRLSLLGFQGTLYVAGSLNALLAILAFSISFSLVSSVRWSGRPPHRRTTEALWATRSASLIFLFRLDLPVWDGGRVDSQYTPYLGNVVYAFAGILAVYLMATVLGSLDYRSQANSHQPDESAPAWSFLALFALIPWSRLTREYVWIHSNGRPASRRHRAVLRLLGYLTPLLVDSFSSAIPIEREQPTQSILRIHCRPLVAGSGYCLAG